MAHVVKIILIEMLKVSIPIIKLSQVKPSYNHTKLPERRFKIKQRYFLADAGSFKVILM